MPDSFKKSQIKFLVEPFSEEIERIRNEEFSKEAIEFAYQLEALNDKATPTKTLKTNGNKQILKQTNKFYDRYYYKNSASLGILLTNIDKSRIQMNANKTPDFYLMGSERIKLALAQRALFFQTNQNTKVHQILDEFENNKQSFPKRNNKPSLAIEYALGIDSTNGVPIRTPAFTEIGYKKISSAERVSRNEIVNNGLFNFVGKYPRKIIGLGAMPPVTGWKDILVISAIGHMLSFAPRSSIYAHNIKLRVNLINSAKNTIKEHKLNKKWQERAIKNIGAALGISNPKEELKIAKELYKETGVKSFRLYTIGSDPRVIETAKLLRSHFGDEIEIFVGQIADIPQAEQLVAKDIKVDGLIYGHGGGQQCTSATNGMALTNLEDLYLATQNPKLNNTSILAEGGIGRSIGVALLMGVDATLGNQKLVRGSIETMNLFIKDKNGDICQPYPGTASPVTQLIEAEDKSYRLSKLDPAGRTYQSEGKPGFMYYKNKANSASFWFNSHFNHAARTLADIGVENISEMRKMLASSDIEFFRLLTDRTRYISSAHLDTST